MRIRTCRPTDGKKVAEIVRATGVLDVNSTYAYVLLCDRFGDTCVIAEENDGTPLGFVTGFRLPNDPETIFVWQVGVNSAARGRGVAGAMLAALVDLPETKDVVAMETTVSPSNEASLALFRSFAKTQGAEMTQAEGYDQGLIGGGHEQEDLYRIAPLRRA